MKPTFVRQATLEDVTYVAHNLREEDREEVLAATGMDPRLLLPLSAQEGREILAAGLVHNDRAEILFGVDPYIELPTAGVAWMLSTPIIYDYPVEFVVRCREFYDHFHTRYELLTNFIDARNERHIKWLRWLGFKKLRRVESFGAQNLPFIEFASYRPCA